MTIKIVDILDKNQFNRLALHPLQSWEWGEFRKKTGLEVIRLGKYGKGKLVETAQVTIHPIPFTKYTIGYFPKGGIPSCEMLEELVNVGKKHNCIFIKLEPNIKRESSSHFSRRRQSGYGYGASATLLTSHFSLLSSPHPLFTKYTFQIDLTKSEEELLKAMHPKTRYNIKVAQKHGVKIEEKTDDEVFKTYLDLTFETVKRQKFYAHDRRYHQLMWETLKPSGIAHLLAATYQHRGQIYTLVTWIVFLFNNILYYPYGASSNKFKNTMASNLIMWEVIRFGKKHKAKIFDMWGSLGSNPNPSNPWFGFHRFKKGYGGKLVEFVGSYDLVINPYLYRLYNLSHRLRQIFLTIKSNLLKIL